MEITKNFLDDVFFNDGYNTTVVYHLPEGFKGCINIYFNQPNEKELEIKDDTLLFI